MLSPQDIHPPIGPLMSSCTARNASIRVSKLSNFSVPIILLSSFVDLKYFKTLLSSSQSSSVVNWTLVHKNDTYVSKSGHDRVMSHKIVVDIEW